MPDRRNITVVFGVDRKWSKLLSMSESDSSDSELLLQAFPVPPSDTTDPPSIEKALTSPEEYIKFVRYEASSYPKVLHSGFVPSEPAEEAGQENNSFCSSSSEALPQSNEYLLSNFDSTVEEFRAVKILLSRMELDETHILPIVTLLHGSNRIFFPATMCVGTKIPPDNFSGIRLSTLCFDKYYMLYSCTGSILLCKSIFS
ncbi:unnamed protein product [Dicrocoelium dendriticum]|nr:unnamed protein product [Dicrocoelium dendriticum]